MVTVEKNKNIFVTMLLLTMHIPFLKFSFLRPTYHTCAVTAPLCYFTSASGQLGTIDGSQHLSTSQHPNRTSTERLWVLTRGKNYYIYASLPQIKFCLLPHLQVPGQMCSEVSGRTTITSNGFWISITLQCFPVFCCCPLFNEFLLFCSPHQHGE